MKIRLIDVIIIVMLFFIAFCHRPVLETPTEQIVTRHIISNDTTRIKYVFSDTTYYKTEIREVNIASIPAPDTTEVDGVKTYSISSSDSVLDITHNIETYGDLVGIDYSYSINRPTIVKREIDTIRINNSSHFTTTEFKYVDKYRSGLYFSAGAGTNIDDPFRVRVPFGLAWQDKSGKMYSIDYDVMNKDITGKVKFPLWTK